LNIIGYVVLERIGGFMEESDFLLLVFTPGIETYARLVDMLWDNALFEEFTVNLKCEDPEVGGFLKERFGWAGGEPLPPLPDLILALDEKYPP
jgi:hypothetical protein